MVTLLLFLIDLPPGFIQLILTELNSTPLTVLTIHWMSSGLPTIASFIRADGDTVTAGIGTVKYKELVLKST